MGAEPRNTGTLIGCDLRLEVSGAAHISTVEVFRGIRKVRAAVGIAKVSLKRLRKHSRYDDRWDGPDIALALV